MEEGGGGGVVTGEAISSWRDEREKVQETGSAKGKRYEKREQKKWDVKLENGQ